MSDFLSVRYVYKIQNESETIQEDASKEGSFSHDWHSSFPGLSITQNCDIHIHLTSHNGDKNLKVSYIKSCRHIACHRLIFCMETSSVQVS